MDSNLPTWVRFGREICGDLASAERREWWLANGRGGYAAGTIAGTLTRRYHGLLIAPVDPPLGRHLVFAKADSTLIDGDRHTSLFANRWAGNTIEPQGHTHIDSFHLEGRMPVWRFAVADVLIEQRIWMEPGANTTYVAFRLVPGSLVQTRPLQLRIKLLVNARDHHGSSKPWDFNPVMEGDGSALRVRHPNWFTLYLKARGGAIATEHNWYENFDLATERERGLPDRDSHLCVGEARLELTPGDWVGVCASLEENAGSYLVEAMRRFQAYDAGQLKRAQVVMQGFIDAPDWIRQLTLAADSFVFVRPVHGQADCESVIAGYPWFGDWGRDTMIALPGLTIATGRFDTALRILQTFARFVDQGMLPNVFPGAGDKPDYNSVDAALWYIEAWRAYVEASSDLASLKTAFPVLEEIIDWHVKGTRYNIHVDENDGLLYAGEPGVQITWMDAKVGDWVVTPRIGKPVEINALWYNALESMARLAEQLKQPATRFRELVARARTGFQRFVKADGSGLIDVLDGPNGNEETLRPNQIFAVSLPHSPLEAATQASVVQVCGRELLTSYGLRSLASQHRDYRGIYSGDVWSRDGAYHQGPVWAFLLGHYALAECRVTGDAQAAQSRLTPLRDHLTDAALGSVSEIFDGAPPHTPRGAPVQAWSVACTLEAWWRLEKAKRQASRSEAKNVGQVAA